MNRDAIVDEVRAIRDSIAREYDYDLNSIFQMLRRADKKAGRRLPGSRPRKAAQQNVAAGKRRDGR